MGLSIKTDAKPKNMFKTRKEPKTDMHAQERNDMLFKSQDSNSLVENMEELSKRREHFKMPDLADANERLGLRPVLEEKNRR